VRFAVGRCVREQPCAHSIADDSQRHNANTSLTSASNSFTAPAMRLPGWHTRSGQRVFLSQLSSKEAFTEQVLLRYAAMELERIQDFYQRKELRSLDRLKQYFATLVDRQGQNSSRPGCLLAYLSLKVSDKSSQLSRSARTSAIGRSAPSPATRKFTELYRRAL
jgi:hypothetical protein